MARWVRACLQLTLKGANSVLGLAGMGMILYALWLIRVWYGSSSVPASASPWFMYTFLALGIVMCVITCSGHIAAETVNGHCLSCYMIVAVFLLLLEAGITADVLLNRNWEEDFPVDASGQFAELRKFLKENFEMCKWIGLSVVAVQALSILLAMILRLLGPERVTNYDSDDDYIPTTLPLLRNQARQNPYATNPGLPLKNDSCDIKIS